MRLIKHSIYNLLGLGLPLVVAVFSIPLLIKGLGDARFGLLTLIWALVSYFGLFDLGLGRALTQELASILDGPKHKYSGQVVVTSLILMLALGFFASGIIFMFAPIGMRYIKSILDYQEAINSVYIISVGMPFILLTSGFRGILEAKHHFGIINAIRLPMGIFTFLGPLLVVLYFDSSLEMIALVLVVGRILACIIHGWYAWLAVSSFHGKLSFNKKLLKPLCFSGGWMTVSNVISPLMGYVDRFIIGFTISAAAVAFYTTPQEIVTKLWIIPGALTAVLFPTFASQIFKNKAEVRRIFYLSINIIFLSVTPIALCLILFSNEILSIWINKNFASNSQIYLKIFAIGILINCMAHIPYTLIQGTGNSKITAQFHLIQAPIYFGLLWLLTMKYGVLGASIAWLLRMLFDAVMMFVGSYRLMKWPISDLIKSNFVLYSFVITPVIVGGIYFDLSLTLRLFVEILLVISSLFLLFGIVSKHHANQIKY